MKHQFKKQFGQNFLTDTNLLQAIVADAGITKQDLVLEIGAGAGALTKPLSMAAKRVVSYEIDKQLQEPLLQLQLPNVTFVFADALKTPMETMEAALGEPYALVANLPYYITTPLLFKFLEEATMLTRLTVMVQQEVALRMVAKPGSKDYGILSVLFEYFGTVRITRRVGRKLFYPVPNVDSALVRLDLEPNKFPNTDAKKFARLVRAAFAMRRKTLRNNLCAICPVTTLSTIFDDNFLSQRGEVLSTAQFVAMYYKLEQYL